MNLTGPRGSRSVPSAGMQGGITKVLAGVALAVGGGVAGATLVADTPSPQPAEVSLAAETAAAQAEKAQRASATQALRAAQRARRIARAARRKADESLATSTAMLGDVDKALADSANALTAAQQAESDAAAALTAADNVSARVDTTKIVEANVGGTASVTTDGYSADPASPGPSVTVNVPSSGYIEVWASARLQTEGAVGLVENGQEVNLGQEGFCTGGSPGPDNALFADLAGAAPINLSTPAGAGLIGICGNVGLDGGPILLKVSPGEHTYELQYATCGCPGGGTSEVSNRTLRIAPRL